MQLLSPLRPSDLVNSHSALGQWMEELAAIDRLPLDHVQPRDWGFLLSLRGSARFRNWWTERPFGKHFLLWSSELDRYGSQLLLSSPPRLYAALCSWLDLPQAAEDLREATGESRGWNTRETYSTEIIAALQIPEGSLNASLPNHCETRWGKWLRVDSGNIEHVLDYLLLDRPATWADPHLVSLGAHVFATLALSDSELRIGVCSHWQSDLARKDATRWLKASAPRTRTNAHKRKPATAGSA